MPHFKMTDPDAVMMRKVFEKHGFDVMDRGMASESFCMALDALSYVRQGRRFGYEFVFVQPVRSRMTFGTLLSSIK